VYGYDYVAFEYNTKGRSIHCYNPYIDEHIFFEPAEMPVALYPASYLKKRHAVVAENGKFDTVIDLDGTLERGYIAMEDMNEYYMSSAYRRKKYGVLNYYDKTTISAGFKDSIGTKGDLYFLQSEISFTEQIYKDKYADKFVIICNLSGTSKHKLFYNAETIIKEFLSRHSDAVCITMGDKLCEDIKFEGERIINQFGVYPFRQSMLMTKYANLVIGCESGLMVAATALGAPTIQLMTAANIKNHGGDFSNDYSLQSPCECSPCHKGPYEYIGCPTFEYLGVRYPMCIKFDINVVLNQMEKVYGNWRRKETVSSAEMSVVR